jgi:hypothetical protein
MDENKHYDLIAQEYLQLQKVVEDYDLRAITIKAWSVTFSAAGLSAAYLQGKAVLLLVAGLSAVVFWIVEALWKTNQQAYYPRIREIETYFRTAGTKEAPLITPFKIGTAWSYHFRAKGGYRRAFKIMWWPHVALPHVVVLAASLLLLGLSLSGGFWEVDTDPSADANSAEITPPPSVAPR